MNLSNCILSGIQSWYKSAVKDMTHTQRPSLVRMGEWLQSVGCPRTLGEARTLLKKLKQRLVTYEESGTQLPGQGALQRRVRVLLQAVESAESREGVGVADLVEKLLASDSSVEDVIRSSEGFALAQTFRNTNVSV